MQPFCSIFFLKRNRTKIKVVISFSLLFPFLIRGAERSLHPPPLEYNWLKFLLNLFTESGLDRIQNPDDIEIGPPRETIVGGIEKCDSLSPGYLHESLFRRVCLMIGCFFRNHRFDRSRDLIRWRRSVGTLFIDYVFPFNFG